MRHLGPAILAAALAAGAALAQPPAPPPRADARGSAALTTTAVAPAAQAAGPRDRFPVLGEAEQARAAAAIAASFPARWKAQARVDHAGFASELAVTLPAPLADADATARILEIVGAHAAAFGVLDPRALHGQRDHGDVRIGHGERWTGNLLAHYEGRSLRLYGHFWPVQTPRPPQVDRDKLVERYVGLKGTRPSRCNCRDVDEVVLDASSFSVDAGLAMVCDDGELRPRPAIAVRANLGSATVPGLEGMPRLLDATTREPIDADFVMPPYGEGELSSGRVDAVQAFATNRCLYKDR
jgi:hypothetical protein